MKFEVYIKSSARADDKLGPPNGTVLTSMDSPDTALLMAAPQQGDTVSFGCFDEDKKPKAAVFRVIGRHFMYFPDLVRVDVFVQFEEQLADPVIS